MLKPACVVKRVRKPHRSLRNSLGFTLIETLLALALLTLLMVAIVTSITLYAQYRYRSIEGSRQAKVLLGTIDDLQNDFNACFSLRETSLSGSVMGSEASNLIDIGSNIAQEQFLSFSVAQSQPIRFVGRSNAILLLRQGTNLRFGETEFHPMASECQVLWLASKTHSIRLPSVLEHRRPIEKEFHVPSRLTPSGTGLHRCWMPAVDPHVPREAWQDSRKTGTIVWDKNNEVQHIQFRFYDGHQWRSEWNSHLQENQVPTAVELELTFTGARQKPMRFVLRLPR